MRAVGIDLGSRRIGVAITAGTLATPYETVDRVGDRAREHRRIAEIVAEVEADVVVVGLPLGLDGAVGTAAGSALAEAEELACTVGVPVETYDERLTTVTADRALREMNVRGAARRRVVDQLAAAVMLQSWLDRRLADPAPPTPDEAPPS